MTLFKLVKDSVLFYWRTNLGVFLAVAVGSAILTGALLVGDSVRESLGGLVGLRLGKTEFAIAAQNTFFRDELADDVGNMLNAQASPVLQLRGIVANSDGTSRVNTVSILGVDRRFFSLGGTDVPFTRVGGDEIVLNQPLADRLGVSVGDEVLLRSTMPGDMPKDVPLVPVDELSIGQRLTVSAIVGAGQFGRFSLQANQVWPMNAFVPLEWLQEKVGQEGRANMLLLASGTDADVGSGLSIEDAREAVRKCQRLEDLGLEIRSLEGLDVIEVRSRGIFIDDGMADTLAGAGVGSGLLTYFVNELRVGGRSAPYSMVAAVDVSGDIGGAVPRDMADDEIVIGNWLADDLGAGIGDEIRLSYYVMGEMRRIVEESRSFRVRDIVATEEGGDGYMMPDFPGLADAENCRDWEPGVDIDLDRIRDKDEEYWDRYRGLPKAFVTLRAGREMWGNRFGGLTAVRYSAVADSAQGIESAILDSVNPTEVGLSLGPVRQLGRKAGSEATDFGGLFLGLSMFLIAAAVILVALIFVFGVEKRSGQIGMLLAVGFSPKLVKRLLLGEGAVIALGGAIAGGLAGVMYTRAMIYGLETVWRDAVAGSAIQFHAKGSTIFYGGLSAVVISLLGIWVSLRKQLRREVRQLLSGRIEDSFALGGKGARGEKSLYVAAISLIGALVLVGLSLTGEKAGSAGAFFGAGALLLVGCLALTKTGLRAVAGAFGQRVKGIGGLGIRNSTRRASRSLAVVGMLSVGVFMVIAVGANRKNPLAGADRRDSGTGGFALYGESTIGVLEDLNTVKGRKAIGIDADAGAVLAADIVQLRVRDGDDASCLNLNRAQKPRLLGVQAGRLGELGAFGFVSVLEGAKEDGWSLLETGAEGDTVYAVGDYATVRWALGRNVGDEIEYTDEKGRPFRLKIVGLIKDSILQGNLVISAAEFERRFPSEDGYRAFLIDVTDEKSDEVSSVLSAGLADYGMEVSATVERLARFNAVENSYLSIFQLLGGLGLILGSIGLGLVVMLNVLQRRGELAMMRAVGFGKKMLKKMVLFEHAGLMLTGLACGTVAALVAVAPALKAPGAEVPYVSLAVTIAAIGASGIIWIWAATAFAISGRLLDALRSE